MEVGITVEQAAYLLGPGQGVLFVRYCVEHGQFPGACMKNENGRRKFFIPRKPFYETIGISEEEAEKKLALLQQDQK